MAGASQYLQNQLANWMKGTTFVAAPTTTYLALFTTVPADDSGTGAVEVSGGAYARVAITSSSGWSSISGGLTTPSLISNSGILTFPTPTANWGVITGVGIYDTSSSGNLLWWSSANPQSISTGVPTSFGVGALALSAN